MRVEGCGLWGLERGSKVEGGVMWVEGVSVVSGCGEGLGGSGLVIRFRDRGGGLRGTIMSGIMIMTMITIMMQLNANANANKNANENPNKNEN